VGLNDGMSDEPKKKRARGWMGWTALALLVLYLASIGPATLLFARVDSRGLRQTYRIIYAPLYWAGDHCDPLGEALSDYCTWWDRIIPER
jgi:hypothetical protein